MPGNCSATPSILLSLTATDLISAFYLTLRALGMRIHKELLGTGIYRSARQPSAQAKG